MLWHFWIDITRTATVEANMAANEITREMPTRFVEFSRMILAKIRFVYPIEVSESDGDHFSMLIDDECCSVRHVILLIFYRWD